MRQASGRTLPLQLLIRLHQQIKVAVARVLLDPRLDLLQRLLLDRVVRRAVVDEPDEARGEGFAADFAVQRRAAIRDERAGELCDKVRETLGVRLDGCHGLTRSTSRDAP